MPEDELKNFACMRRCRYIRRCIHQWPADRTDTFEQAGGVRQPTELAGERNEFAHHIERGIGAFLFGRAVLAPNKKESQMSGVKSLDEVAFCVRRVVRAVDDLSKRGTSAQADEFRVLAQHSDTGARIQYFCKQACEGFTVGFDEVQFERHESAEASGNAAFQQRRRMSLQIAGQAEINGKD